ncbi:hypothetical protein RMSM_04297 [Rhodopirellula maiorica SM1]|uniref:Uncharacterized protein n=1 Tax=Rhodopirellula maiorica SM1 TaxID=1265738 RepID=M5RTS7_9BACT|nr:hypothetical protein RMSM_04297 [Rhodopirellula maiorica SM1]
MVGFIKRKKRKHKPKRKKPKSIRCSIGTEAATQDESPSIFEITESEVDAWFSSHWFCTERAT